MAFMQCSFKSEVLGQDVCFNAIIPQNVTDNIKSIYLLHGLSDNHSNWSRFTSVESYVRNKGVAVFMPNVDRSFYTDMKYGRNYYTYISDEFIKYTRQVFKLSTKREDTFIAGLSMGGYGAFKIALRNPDIFSAAASFSGVLDIVNRLSTETAWEKEKMLIVGENPDFNGEYAKEDLKYLLENFDKNAPKVRLYQSCGTEDFLYEDNQNFRKWIKNTDFEHEYHEGPGGHEWKFWDKHIEKAIEFFLKG
ncbi:MAG: esterase family protein [Ruminococcaceae bacterium]|nr:esterase family protein [Oscillospiraceae bacterium]